VFSHLYFSCKNYQELAQARITKVVVQFITNPKKLVLHFSDFSVIFYAIYKNQSKLKYYLRITFAARPSKFWIPYRHTPVFAENPLERKGASQCGPWAAGRRGSGQIPTGPAAGWSG
jgi:hypothetical protein